MSALKAIILTALTVEYKACRLHLEGVREVVHPSGTVYEIGTFQGAGDAQWEIGLAEIGAGNSGAAAEAERAIAFFRPDVVLFVGVAGGIKDVAIGDVVVGTKVYGYESGKEAKEFQIRPAVFNSSYDLQQRARAEAKREDWLTRVGKSSPLAYKVFVAPIAAGEKVIASRQSVLFAFIQENYGDALAVEMEGRGFLEAAHANQQVRALVVRGISDLIDQKAITDAKGSQELAMMNASGFAFEVLAKFSPPQATATADKYEKGSKPSNSFAFAPSDEVERLIGTIALGDWNKSADAAICLIQKTRADGANPIFDALLRYYACPIENLRWAATQVTECVVRLFPDLLRRDFLIDLATRSDFSNRASAASICMELANVDPSRVPLDILIPLSTYDEDWYVQAPANAALKTMLSTMPKIYQIFRGRLRSTNADEREHAASQLADIAKTEPWLLDADDLQAQARWLRSSKHNKAATILIKILPLVRGVSQKSEYKYGL